jgi:hypothetical protein
LIKDLVGLAGVPFVVALTEAVKVVAPELPARFYPLVAIVWGLGLNLLAAQMLGVSPLEAAVEGVAAGLAAAGLYSAARSALAK